MNAPDGQLGKGMRGPTIRFFNTVEPVVSLYRLLGESLIAAGYAVEIVVTSASYRPGGTSLPEWAETAGARVVLLPGVTRYPRRGLFKFVVAAYYAIFAFGYAMFARPSAVNVFLTQPPLFFSCGWLLRKVRSQPFVCIAMDLYPDILVAFGKLSPEGLPFRIISRFARAALKRADAVVAIGRCMSERLARAGVSADAIRLIPNWAEFSIGPGDEGRVNATRSVMDGLGLTGRFVVLYSGNMGAGHSFDELLDAAARLRSHARIFFLMVGEGVRREAVVRRIEREGLNNVRVLPYLDWDQAARLMMEADAHLVTQRTGFEGLVVPSKAYAALAAGKPLIYVGRPDGEIARMVLEESIGFVIPPGDAGQLVDACIRLEAAPAERVEIGVRARTLASGRYGRDRAARQYTDLLAAIASASRHDGV